MVINSLTARLFCCTLIFAFPLPLFAEVKAVIEGPTQGNPGDLIILDGGKSVGDGHRWISPSNLQTLSCGDIGPGQLAFASGKPGQYVFTLIVADKEAAIDYVTHTVTIGSPTNPPNPPNPPTIPPVLASLEKLSRESAAALNDPTTAKAIAAAIRNIDAQITNLCSRNQCPSLPTAKAMMVAAIENTLLLRRNNVSWAEGWRVPTNKAIISLNITDVPTYQTAMRALATGLEQ